MAKNIANWLPSGWIGRYYEPFLGGGAVFFTVAPARATLGDRNADLIATYEALRQDVEGVIAELIRYPYSETFYYDLRDRRPRKLTTRAARFLYLNRTCFNGLYRVNRKGQFNTPFGSFANPTVCDPERLRLCSRALRDTRLVSGDFESTVARAKPGDFVYFDPPYITGHNNNGFIKYNQHLFKWSDQERLAGLAIELTQKGVHVMVSNADHKSIAALYPGFHHFRIARKSAIAGDESRRGEVIEAIYTNYPLASLASLEKMGVGNV